MAGGRREQASHRAPRRLSPSGILGLELWDQVVAGDTLFGARRRADFPARLASALVLLRAGRGVREVGGPLAAATFERIFVGGGAFDARREDMLAALRARGFVADALPGGRMLGAVAGLVLLDGVAGLVVDVGQTAVKVAWSSGRVLVERDLSALPVQSRSGNPRHRAALVELIGGAIARARLLAGPVARVIVALPAALDDDGTPRGSSYPGMAGDAQLVADALLRGGVAEADALVLNDAELAAVAAHEHLAPGATALVLTLGFGVGAALLTR